MTVPTAAEWREAYREVTVRKETEWREGVKAAVQGWAASIERAQRAEADLADAAERITALEGEVSDWRDAAQRAASETCGDERHCTCVAPLRAEVERLTKLSSMHDDIIKESISRGDELADRLRTAYSSAALWEAEAGRLRKALGPSPSLVVAEYRGLGKSEFALDAEATKAIRVALSRPRPAPGAVVALVSDRRAIKAALGFVPTTAEERAALDAGITRLQVALARALGMEESP